MKENIYIKALEIGFKHQTTGISFNDVVIELGIKEDLKNLPFKVNFTTWFYTNFYLENIETLVLNSNRGEVRSKRISEETIAKIDDFSFEKSFIKGESTQKYIDYLELRDTRKSARTARIFSIISIIIASIAIITPYVVSLVKPEEAKQVVVIENRDDSNDLIYQKLTEIDSTINLVVKEFNQTKLKQLVVTAPKKITVLEYIQHIYWYSLLNNN